MSKEMVSGLAPTGTGDIYFERRGVGPPLLLIVGGGGDCGYYAEAAQVLMEHYSVVSYDRRGNSRSVLAACGRALTMPRQSADALAVLACNGFASARVFGNSGGATIALDLAAHHPEVVQAAVFHEPPVPEVLPEGPDRARYLGIADEIDHLLTTGSWQAALALFLERIGGPPAEGPEALTALLDPAKVLPPGPLLETMLRLSHNWEFMIRYEVRPFLDYQPDLGGLVANDLPMVLARGETTTDTTVITIAERAAGLLGVECVEFPGGHTSPAEIPAAFAMKLHQVLERL